jgi:hypothetical protein
MHLNYNRLTVGDRLVREKGGILSKHHAIYAGFNNFNQQLVAENQVNYGVRYITLDQFLREGKLIKVEHHNASYSTQQVIISRINQRLGKAYNLLGYNCEHFVNEVLLGKRKSPQVEKGAGVVGVLALFLMAGRG